MHYHLFVAAMKEKVALLLDESMSLEMHTTLKNNGNERIGLTIEDKCVNIFPTIYLEEYYKQYLAGASMDSIAESILNVYREVKLKESWQLSTLENCSAIRSKIVYKLIHAKKNEKLLQTVPHIPYLDLAIVFYILLDVNESGTATILITNDLLEVWGIRPEEIHRIASQNSATLLPSTFKPMSQMIHELLGKPSDDPPLNEDNMYVLTNSLGSFGAICILYDGMLKQIGDQLGENYYVLPSSVHEVIIIAEGKGPCKEDLDSMVAEVNETQLEPEEVLSDHAYYYDRAKEQLL